MQPSCFFPALYSYKIMKVPMKLFQITFLITTIIGSGLTSSAQHVEKDAVYLNNGSILRGRVIENVAGDHVKIEMVGSNLLVIPEKEINRVVFGEKAPVMKKEAKSGVEVFPAISFYGGSDFNSGFTVTTSCRFPGRLSAGAGIGVEWFNTASLPVFAEGKYYFLNGTLSPFLYAQGGYALALAKNQGDQYTGYHGGPLFGAGVGLRKDFTVHNAFIFSLGYRYQQTRTVYDQYYWYSSEYQTERIDKYNRLAFTVGFLFN